MVRIENISLQNFRGIREGKLDGLGDVNILIGRNNAGKSSVAEAISRFAHVAGGGATDALHRNKLNVWKAHRHEEDDWHSELLHRPAESNRVSISAQVQADATQYGLNVVAAFSDDPVPRFQGASQQGGSVEGISLASNESLKRFMQGVTVFLASDGNNPGVEQVLWDQLVTVREDKSLAAALNDIFGAGIEGMTVPPDGRIRLLFPQYSLRLDSQGEGARSAVRCLLVLAAMRRTMLILEEPESHQHPGSLARFARALCNRAKAQEVQLLLTTHSVECIDAFLAAANDARSSAAVFHLSTKDGLLDVRRLSAETVKSLEETGLDVRRLDLYA